MYHCESHLSKPADVNQSDLGQSTPDGDQPQPHQSSQHHLPSPPVVQLQCDQSNKAKTFPRLQPPQPAASGQGNGSPSHSSRLVIINSFTIKPHTLVNPSRFSLPSQHFLASLVHKEGGGRKVNHTNTKGLPIQLHIYILRTREPGTSKS